MSHTTLSYADLEYAYHYVTAAGDGSNLAYVSKVDGSVYRSSPDDPESVPLPEDVDNPAIYCRIPDKHELKLGVALVFRFTRDEIPSDMEKVEEIFRSRGAYRQFRYFLERRGKLQAWYDYSERAMREALLAWAAKNEITVSFRST